jgi:alpha-glucosidase (family GH31 glycosyl hydrolase)
VAFIRSGWTGVHPCAQVVWGGDPTTAWGFDGLESAVKQALSLGTSGISRWGSDIGGFFAIINDQLTPEMLSRWIEFGAVSGVMRTQANGFAVNPPGTRAQIFDADNAPIWRRYSKLRTQIYPYLKAADSEYLRTGMPIMRHLALTNPDDPIALGQEDEFMFGEELLAAPVLEPGATTRTVYLPEGRWIDFWRAVRYRSGPGSLELKKARAVAGGRSTTIPAPLDELPLMVKAGAMLALLPSRVDTLAPYGADATVRLDEVGKRLHLLAFPRGKSGSGFGERGYLGSREKKGRWRLTIHGARKHRIALEASLTTMKRDLDPCRVTVNGKVLKKKRWDVGKGVLEASFKAKKDPTRVTVHDSARC